MAHRIIPVILILGLLTLACGFSFSIPARATPGPDITDKITVPAPMSGEEARLTLSFGAGNLKLSPGAQNALVDGTAVYNLKDFKPEVITDDGSVEIRQGNVESIPTLEGMKNEWAFKLGSVPLNLTIHAGAYDAEYEFGGLTLTGLTVRDGAADVKLSFSKPNQSEMSVFRYETGASDVELNGLANANFNTFIFQGGAGDYTLDFSGELKRDATVTISSGFSNLILLIPEGVAANVTVESGLANIDAGPGWARNGDLYTQSGSGPTLTFIIKTGAGNLTLTR